MRKLPPLNALKAFEAAARKQSFTAAAQELRVSQGAISRHIANLEDWLETKLFLRHQRGIGLTPAGMQYYQGIGSAFDRLEDETRRLRNEQAKNLLRLKVPPTFAVRWLVPRLARFHAMNRKIDVQITTSHQSVDFEREDIDGCIQWSARARPTGQIHYLFGETILPVCSAAFLESTGGLQNPSELRDHVLLCSLHRLADWPLWLRAAGVRNVDGNGGLKFENSTLAYQAAIEGLGVVMAQKCLVDDDLRIGRLVKPFDLEVETGHGYIFAYLTTQPKSEGLKLFEEWILTEVAMMNATEAGQKADITAGKPDFMRAGENFKLSDQGLE
jgi:LysR family transcriptional regulator, glycine cleavage system transcriptional activator